MIVEIGHEEFIKKQKEINSKFNDDLIEIKKRLEYIEQIVALKAEIEMEMRENNGRK